MDIKLTLSNIEDSVTTELSKQLEKLQQDIPKIVKRFIDDYAEILMLSVFGVYIDTWGDMEVKQIPQKLKETLVDEAMKHLPKVTLSKKHITQLNKKYTDSLYLALERQMYSIAQNNAKTIVEAAEKKLQQDLDSVTNLEHFVKTLNFIQQTETPS